MIRHARADEAVWVADAIAAAFRGCIPRMGRVPAPMMADHAALIAAGEVYVCEEEGARLGLIVMRGAADHLHVDILAVLPAAQHRGTGQQMMRFAEGEALKLGLPTVRLYTNTTMTETRRFYLRLGYRQVDARCEDGFDRVFFEKRLA